MKSKRPRLGRPTHTRRRLLLEALEPRVVLDGQFTGIQKGSGQATDRVGVDASTTINRLDYGVTWNRAAEGGGVMLGDDFKIEINVEAVKARS